MWDISYYGNKLFQSSFIVALTGEDASLLAISVGELIAVLPELPPIPIIVIDHFYLTIGKR